MGVKIVVHEDETVLQAVRRFRKEVELAGVRREMRKRTSYEKPGYKRRQAAYRRLRGVRKWNRLGGGYFPKQE